MAEIAGIGESFVATWPTIFAMDLSRYVVAAGAMAILLFALAGRLATRRIQDRRATRRDVSREILHSLGTVLVFSLVGFLVFRGTRSGLFSLYGGALPGWPRLVAEFVVLVVLHDAYFYWAHRMMHTRLLFRRVHRLHHRSRTPTPWAAYSFAPPEALIEAAFLPFAAFFMPVHELSVLLFLTHMIVRNVFGHAGVELFPSWWLDVPVLRRITTTTHHDLHHSSGASNFGLYFTWWDQWLGTEHPQYRERFHSVTRSRIHNRSNLKETS